MNSQNPNPNEGQQPGAPSEGGTGQEPAHAARPGNAGPENAGPESARPENAGPDSTGPGNAEREHTEPEDTKPAAPENPTEPLFTRSGTHAGPAYGAPAYGTGY